MGFFSKLKSLFKGKQEDDFDGLDESGDFDISSDEGVDELLTNDGNDDFANEVNSDFDSGEEEFNSFDDNLETTPANEESYHEENQDYTTSQSYDSNEGESSYYDVADQSYDNANFDNQSYKQETNYSFESDQNLTQPNEEIFMEIQNRIKMIREKTEELKRLREKNQLSEQEAKE